MAFDIYGQHLERGHCEVHPWVGEEYPCSICIEDNRRRKQERDAEAAYYRSLEEAYYLSLVENTDGAGI